jgi:hypothetical protein
MDAGQPLQGAAPAACPLRSTGGAGFGPLESREEQMMKYSTANIIGLIRVSGNIHISGCLKTGRGTPVNGSGR